MAQSKFEKEVVKRMEAKTPKETAKQVERLAESHLKGQVAALNGSVVTKEMAVEDATEAVNVAIYPTSVNAVKDGSAYINGIINSQKALVKAEKELAETKELILTLEKVLADFK
jgi:phage terminase large subunit